MATWELTYNGVTKSLADWGISQLKRKEQAPVDADMVTFKLDGTSFATSPLPFPCSLIPGVLPFNVPTVTITKNGAPWFSGIVTKPMPKAKGNAQSIDYEIAGPWYWLEKTPFQQQWLTSNVVGDAIDLISTTRSETIIGQSVNGVKMTLGQVMLEVLIYAQYAYQMIPLPATMNMMTLTASAPAVASPFIIGTLEPSITVPYFPFNNRSCADVLRMLLKYTPDASVSWDFTTSPPTINIKQRASLPQKTIQCRGTSLAANGYVVQGFDPTPRYDLQVPCVVAKFQEKNDFDGVTYDNLVVQVWPPAPAGIDPTAWASQPRAWVQALDLIGGHTTQQTADLKVIARPVGAGDAVALNWALGKLPNLTARAPSGATFYDLANIGVYSVQTTLDAADPLRDPEGNPNNLIFDASGNGTNDCPELVSELLTSGFAPWLQEDPNHLDAAKVAIQVLLKYTGTDAATAALFTYDPTTGKFNLTAGAGYYPVWWKGKVTNASTQTYNQLTSWSAAEPAPSGFAQSLGQALQPLYFQGTFTIVEQECSGLLPVGCTFNTTDGNPDWQVMNAMVTGLEEDIFHGTSTVTFGPPPHLSLEEMEQLFRANLGVLPSYKLAQRTTGKLTAGSNVIGDQHFADTHVITATPTSVTNDPNPFAPTDASVGATPKVALSPGMVNGQVTAGSPIAVGIGAGTVYVQCAFTYDAYNNVTLTSNTLQATTGVVPASTCNAGGGTFYWPLASFTGAATGGKARTSPHRLVNGSINFGVCNGAILIPA